ncbi:MAG: LamG-like jellyroll fold domain-containing protein, partial [Verrucomicrobiota bacterium]
MTSACAAGSPRLSQLLAHLRLILVALLLIPCSLLAQTNCTPSPSGLVAWWPGDGFSFDVAGTNHGTLYNGATYAPGKVGTAFSFDGVDDTVWVNPGPSLNFTNAITLEAWINHRRVGSGIQRYLTVVSEIAQIRYDGLASPAGFHFAINVGGAFYDLRPGISPQTNTFYHVVGTYDGTVQRLYINGTLRAIQTVGGALAPATTTGVMLSSGGEAMNGLIDEARIFKRALSAGEVASLYAAGSAGMCFTSNPAPVILQQPQTQTGYTFNSVTLTGAAMGTPRPTIQWMFNGAPLINATNATLVLNNLSTNQAGDYSVIASNMFGSVTSTVAHLSVVLPGFLAGIESFETGWSGWFTDNTSVWEAGVPTSGPNAAHSGNKCLATVLGGNYPRWADSRAISPAFVVPAADQSPRLRFWHWFETWGPDYGCVEVRPLGSNSWVQISPNYSDSSAVWTYALLDLRAYAGQNIQIAFHFVDDGGDTGWSSYTPTLATGWYLDQVTLVAGPIQPLVANVPESFEGGLGGRSVDQGVWETGTPTSGPGSAHAGTNCLGTVLAGNYPRWADSRAISPAFVV